MKNTDKEKKKSAFAKILKKREPRPQKPPKHPELVAFCNRFAPLLQFLGCIILYFYIEAVSRHSIRDAWTFVDDRTKVFFYNAFLIYVTTLFVFLLRRRSFWRTLVFLFWFLLGTMNGVILANRVTPLTGPDMQMFTELQGVISKYFDGIEVILVTVGLIVLVVLLFGWFFHAPKYQGKRKFRFIIPGILIGWAALFGLTQYLLEARQLSSFFSNIAYAYLDYGFPYSLSVTLFDTGIDEPNHYSQELVDSVIAEEGEIAETTADGEESPNVIVIQLESFFDPTEVKWLKFNEDPLPNWHALSKEYSHGLYTVPTVGAGTVNTEFETLTGMSLRFFGPGEYPYKGILREQTTESAATVLTKLGYTAHAIHNNTATFYGRRTVYSYLGFNSFTSEEYMDTQNDTNYNDWMRDENLIDPIVDALDSTENRDFVYTVSVQPHGAYPTEPVLDDPVITVSGAATDEENCAWEYYANQLYEVDQFVADLIQTIEDRGEPTVIFFYGDHLPTMGLEDSDLTTDNVFDTNYLMWDNIGLDQKNGQMYSYQAMAKVFNRLGIHDGVMFNYQQKMWNKENYFYDMQILQYDMLYGNRYVFGGTNPYSRTVLAMGVKPISIESIQKVSADGIYYVYGENLTQSCKLMVNDEVVDTTYLDHDKLLIKGVQLEEGDWVKLIVQANSSSHMTLSTSNTLVYGVGKLTDDDDSLDAEARAEALKEAALAEAQQAEDAEAGNANEEKQEAED